MSEKKINVGIIGYGMSAKVFHVPLVLSLPKTYTLHSILQRSPSPSNSAPNDHPTVSHHTTLVPFLADPSLDLVVITTTPDSHFQLCTQILAAKKHILCEKPFVPSASQAEELAALSASSGKFICIYQNRRWDSDFLTVRKLQDEGTLGRIVEFQTNFDRYKAEKPSNWKGQLAMDNGGGVIYDLGTHLLDQVYTLFGLPETVNGFFRIERDGEISEGEEPDSFTAVLGYGSSGPLVIAKASVISIRDKQPRFVIKGTKGTYEKFYLDVQEDQLKAGLKPGDQEYGIEGLQSAGTLTTMGADGQPKKESFKSLQGHYEQLYERFSEAILKNQADLVPVKIEQVADVLRIIEAVRESAKSGNCVRL